MSEGSELPPDQFADNLGRTLESLGECMYIRQLHEMLDRNLDEFPDQVNAISVAAMAWAEVSSTFMRLIRSFQLTVPENCALDKAIASAVCKGYLSRDAAAGIARITDCDDLNDITLVPPQAATGATQPPYPSSASQRPVSRPSYLAKEIVTPAAVHTEHPFEAFHRAHPRFEAPNRFMYEPPYHGPPGHPIYGPVAYPTHPGLPPWYVNHFTPQPWYSNHAAPNIPGVSSPAFFPSHPDVAPYAIPSAPPIVKPTAYIDLTNEVDARLAARHAPKSSDRNKKRKRDSPHSSFDSPDHAGYDKRLKHTHQQWRGAESYTQHSQMNTQTGDSSFSSMHEELALREKRRLEQEEPRIGKKRRIEDWVSGVGHHAG